MHLPILLSLIALICCASWVHAEDVAPGGKLVRQSEDKSITLHARDATVHGATMHYETSPEKNTLGYWVNEKDWASWEFEVVYPGTFIVVAMQGSPGSSEVDTIIGDQTLHWTTKNTSSYHTFTFNEIGRVTLDKKGPLTLSVKPTKKDGGAIMDLRQIILLPVLP